MQRCWAQNPYDRPGFSEIIQELRAIEADAPQVPLSPAASSVKISSRATSERPSSVAPPAAPRAGSYGGSFSGGSVVLPATNPRERESYPDADYEGYEDDQDDEYRLATASVSSTAVLASVDHTASLPQWHTKTGWGSKPTK